MLAKEIQTNRGKGTLPCCRTRCRRNIQENQEMEQRKKAIKMARKLFTNENIERLHEGPGVYKLYKKNAKKPTYIGSSRNLRERLMAQKRDHRFHSFAVHHMNSTKQARNKEKNMIKKNQPRRNQLLL